MGKSYERKIQKRRSMNTNKCVKRYVLTSKNVVGKNAQWVYILIFPFSHMKHTKMLIIK